MLDIVLDLNLFSTREIEQVIVRKLIEADITYSVSSIGNTIHFSPLKSGRVFESKKINHLVMGHDDKRRHSLGRDFLNTHKLTKEQYDTMLGALLGTLDKLDVSARVSFKGEAWRTGKTNITSNIPFPKIFPQKG